MIKRVISGWVGGGHSERDLMNDLCECWTPSTTKEECLEQGRDESDDHLRDGPAWDTAHKVKITITVEHEEK